MSKTTSTASSVPEIEYTAYTVTELSKDLDDNALKAADKYKGQYVELTGRLSVIDSDGKYISIADSEDEWALLGVQCYIKNDEQKQAVMDMSIGDEIVVKGKITNVGEVMSYTLDMTEVPIKKLIMQKSKFPSCNSQNPCYNIKAIVSKAARRGSRY